MSKPIVSLICLLLLVLSCAAQTQYVTSVQNTGNQAQLIDMAGAANVVYVVSDGTDPVVSDSGLNRYVEMAQAGTLSVWVALNVSGETDTVQVQNGLGFAVVEYSGVKTMTVHSGTGAGFMAGMFVSSNGPASISWALFVYPDAALPFYSAPFRGPAVRQSLLFDKFVVGDNAMNAGMAEVQVPVTSCNAGGGAFHMIVLDLQ